jgi:hypothetical protein
MSQNQRTQRLERELNQRMPDKDVRVIERDDGTMVAGARDPETGEVQTREIDAEQMQSAGGARPTKGPSGSESVQEARNQPSAGGARPTQGPTQGPDETADVPDDGRGGGGR